MSCHSKPVAAASAAVGDGDTVTPITSFSDKQLADSIFIIQLTAAVAAADSSSSSSDSSDTDSPLSSSFVNWSDVVPAKQCVGHREHQLRNASYALSLSRKLNATIFLLAEDIVEHRARLILTLFASLMTVDLSLTTKRNKAMIEAATATATATATAIN